MYFLEPVAVAGDPDDVRAAGGQGSGDGASETPAGAGDEERFPFEAHEKFRSFRILATPEMCAPAAGQPSAQLATARERENDEA